MKVTDPKFLEALRCTHCQADLDKQESQLVCTQCKAAYPIQNSVPYIVDKELINQYGQYQEEAKTPINKFKSLIKKSPWFFQFLTYAIGSVSYFGWSPTKALGKLYKPEELKYKIIINIGSGIKNIHPEVINLDIFPFKSVDLVTDATKLPLKDNSVDMISTESTLEHIPDVDLAIKEICRVVKPGGYVYISIPFMMPFHASPNDYFRLTSEGIKHKFAQFETSRTGMRGGPASALVTFLMHFFALPFSIISTSAYNFATYFFMAILSPLRIFDLLYYLFPRSLDAAAVTYFIGKKK